MPTLKEIYEGQSNWIFGTNYTQVKPDTETLIEQETSGIRIRSAVELNNPIIYGNESIRIVNRSTSTLDTMKSQTGGEGGDGGLIGQGLSKLTGGKVSSISQARDAVNSKLGIPSNPIPSRLIGDISKLTSIEPITKDTVGQGLQGTGLGQFLKDTGGGNPKTLGKQALGKGIGLAKDKLRGALFGQGQSIGDAIGDDNGVRLTYNNENTYSKYNREERNIFEEGGIISDSDNPIPFGNQSIDRIDLKKVSPIYGLNRKPTDGRFGNTEYGFVDRRFSAGGNNAYSPVEGENYSATNSFTLEKMGLTSNNGDRINIMGLPTSDGRYTDGDTEFSKAEMEKSDLIPFWISGLDSSKPVFFRTLITGLNENVTPSWSSGKFIGNPYSYYTYDGVERNVSFSLKIYCMNQVELVKNWEKINFLTSKAYPNIKDNLVYPPFIKFRLGDIYNNRTGFIEQLNYTIPDGGVWETDSMGTLLPKFIDVNITIKFVEVPGSELSLYSYKKSQESIQKIKEEVGATEQGGGEDNPPPKVDSATGQFLDSNDKPDTGGVKNGGTKNISSGKSESTPGQSQKPVSDETIRTTSSSEATTELEKRIQEYRRKVNDIEAAKKLAKRYGSQKEGLELKELRKESEGVYYIKEYLPLRNTEREFAFKQNTVYGRYPKGYIQIWSFENWQKYQKALKGEGVENDGFGNIIGF
jgi:hypothetical protein